MQMSVQIGGVILVALLDSGSTHNFINDQAVDKTGMKLSHRTGLSVFVANGDRLSNTGVCRSIKMAIGQEHFSMDYYTIPLDEFGVVLDVQWLCMVGPILWDFDRFTMSFWCVDHRVTWQGKASKKIASVHACTERDLVTDLLLEFHDLFAEPVGLPPRCDGDHRIPGGSSLLPVPANSEGRAGMVMCCKAAARNHQAQHLRVLFTNSFGEET